jgi:predicted phage-related endonuclease
MIADLSKLGLSPEQIAQRRFGIGGSDATTIMGGNPEKLVKLWEEKTGRREPDDLSDVLCVQLGSWTEPFNAAWYQKTTGNELACRNHFWPHESIEWWRANLDGIVLSPLGRNHDAVWEAKHVSGWEDLDETVVPRYTPQVYHNMHAAGCGRGVLSILVGTSELRVFEFRANPMYLARLIERETEFWEYVQQDTPPPEWLDIAPPPPVTEFRSVSMEGVREWAEAAQTWLSTKEMAKHYERSCKELRGMMDADVGEAIGHGIIVKRSKNGSLLINEYKPKRGKGAA